MFFNNWKSAFESKRMKVNMGKVKMMEESDGETTKVNSCAICTSVQSSEGRSFLLPWQLVVDVRLQLQEVTVRDACSSTILHRFCVLMILSAE